MSFVWCRSGFAALTKRRASYSLRQKRRVIRGFQGLVLEEEQAVQCMRRKESIQMLRTPVSYKENKPKAVSRELQGIYSKEYELCM